jgi:hypothetical protein
MNGKGDKPRPVDRKVYRENFDAINWHRVVICPSCGWEIDPELCHCGQLIGEHMYNGDHTPVPMGCTCMYADAANMKNPAFKK